MIICDMKSGSVTNEKGEPVTLKVRTIGSSVWDTIERERLEELQTELLDAINAKRRVDPEVYKNLIDGQWSKVIAKKEANMMMDANTMSIPWIETLYSNDFRHTPLAPIKITLPEEEDVDPDRYICSRMRERIQPYQGAKLNDFGNFGCVVYPESPLKPIMEKKSLLKKIIDIARKGLK
jgi:hypothetical protein